MVKETKMGIDFVVPARDQGGKEMSFWVLENTQHNYAKIHRAECGYCKDGQGPRLGHTGRWIGPFAPYAEALAAAKDTRRHTDSVNCKGCKPQSFD